MRPDTIDIHAVEYDLQIPCELVHQGLVMLLDKVCQFMMTTLVLDLLQEVRGVHLVDFAISRSCPKRVHVLPASRAVNIPKRMGFPNYRHFNLLNMGLVEFRSVGLFEVLLCVDLCVKECLDTRLELSSHVLV